LITLTVGPVAAETVPAPLMATASGVVIAAGEILGGGLAPIIGGQLAQRFGIDHILQLPLRSWLTLAAKSNESHSTQSQSAGDHDTRH